MAAASAFPSRWLVGLIAALALAAAGNAGADVEDHLQFQWYRIELILFANPRAAVAVPEVAVHEEVAARRVLLDAMRLPNNALPLIEEAAPLRESALGVRLAPDEPLPLLFSDLAPPVWFAGSCVSESWQPPANASAATAFDPCLPRPDVDLEAEFNDDPSAAWPSPSAVPERSIEVPEALEEQIDERQAALDALRDYEDDLLSSSYRWQRRTSVLADSLRRLQRKFPVLAAGSWHQPVPPRDQSQPVLMQLGTPDAEGRFALEGWFSVTLGRYVHFGAHLQYRPTHDAIALLSENRRLRPSEVHYLDHPALGILAHIERLRPPDDLQRRFDEVATGASTTAP